MAIRHRLSIRAAAVAALGLAAGLTACRAAPSGTALPEPWPALPGDPGATEAPPATAGGEIAAPPALLQPGAPVAVAERLEVGDARVLERSGQLSGGGAARFVLALDEASTLEVDVSSVENAVLPAVAGDDGTGLKYHTDGRASWHGTVPSTQDYHIALVNTLVGEVAYRLRVEAVPGTAETGGKPLFAGGSRVTVLPLGPSPDGPARFPFPAEAGEALVAVVEPSGTTEARLVLRAPDGREVTGAAPGTWRGELPVAGTYSLELPAGDPALGTVIAARLVSPTWLDDTILDARISGDAGEAVAAAEVPLGAGAYGGARYRLSRGTKSRATIELLTLHGTDRAIVTVTEGSGRLAAVLEAVEGAAQSVRLADGETTISLLFAGGASGTTVAYEARFRVD